MPDNENQKSDDNNILLNSNKRFLQRYILLLLAFLSLTTACLFTQSNSEPNIKAIQATKQNKNNTPGITPVIENSSKPESALPLCASDSDSNRVCQDSSNGCDENSEAETCGTEIVEAAENATATEVPQAAEVVEATAVVAATATTKVVVPTATTQPTEQISVPIPGSLPLGVWSLNDDARAFWGTKYTGATIWTSPKKIINFLEEAQSKGMRVVISLAGYGKSDYQNPDDTFNLGLWKASVDRYAGINLDKYINNGTIIAHYLVDEPKSRSNWGGDVIPNDILDAMAQYSKQRWPNMATAVRVTPTDLAENAGGYDVPLPDWKWNYLDTAWLQYSNRKGPINGYISAESQSANQQGLGLIVGLNPLTGGDGSSGKPGPDKYSDKWTMSKNELLAYGMPLINSHISCAFLMWTYRYDYDTSYNFSYFGLPEISAAVDSLKEAASQTSQNSCKR